MENPIDYLNNTKIALIRKNDHIALVTTKNVQNTPDTEKKTNALQKKEKKKKKRPNYLWNQNNDRNTQNFKKWPNPHKITKIPPKHMETDHKYPPILKKTKIPLDD